MLQKTKDYMAEKINMEPGSKIVLGLSGGMDSAALLYILRGLGYELTAVHVHHGIRGAEADRDLAFVRQLCESCQISLREFFYDVPEIARQKHLSIEEAGRLVRRESFEQVRQEWGADYTALAHHANDRAETMLFHLCRGTGLKGLVSMKAVDGFFIRPILWASREEIEGFVREQGIAFVEDSSNAKNCYTRNRIRHEVMPVLTTVNDRAIQHMTGTAQKLEKLESFLERETKKAWQRCVVFKEKEIRIIAEEYLRCDEALQVPLLQKCVLELSESGKDFSEKHYEMLQKLFFVQNGREISLPCEILAVKVYEGICIYRKGLSDERAEGCADEVICREGSVEFLGKTFEIKIQSIESLENFSAKNYTKCFDYDKIKGTVVLRTRKPGDYLTINREGGRKSLQDYMVNEKIPKEQRDQIPVLAEGSHVLWVVGKRISEYYKITEDTKRVFKVHLTGGSENELSH